MNVYSSRIVTQEQLSCQYPRVILRDLLGPIQMCPGEDGSLWAEYRARPAALVKKAVGASAELNGSGGVICAVPTVPQRLRLK